ncbi:MAG: hypothetical protein ACFCU8_00270 [Thermosynechococcaceae cyanobacterium]
MSLQDQIQTLIHEAPQDGQTPQAMEAIGPVLAQVAHHLNHLEYYILQNLGQNWQITTLHHQNQPNLEKTVVYAYANLKDATHSCSDPHLIAVPKPVILLLFQLLAMKPVDSLIFFDHPKGQDSGFEVSREAMQELVQESLRQFVEVPSDFA